MFGRAILAPSPRSPGARLTERARPVSRTFQLTHSRLIRVTHSTCTSAPIAAFTTRLTGARLGVSTELAFQMLPYSILRFRMDSASCAPPPTAGGITKRPLSFQLSCQLAPFHINFTAELEHSTFLCR